MAIPTVNIGWAGTNIYRLMIDPCQSATQYTLTWHSEAAMQGALMCSPEYFALTHQRNAWMTGHDEVDSIAVERQWTGVKMQLEAAGVNVHVLPGVRGLPDMTFVANAGFAFGRRFIQGRLRHPERGAEAPIVAGWFQDRGYEVIEVPEGEFFEGVGDIVSCPEAAILCVGPRTTAGAQQFVEEVLDELPIRATLAISDPTFYHGGMALSVIDQDTVVYHPGAFSSCAGDVLRRAFRNVVEVSAQDAIGDLVCNCVCIDKRILLPRCPQHLRSVLESFGFDIVECETSEFQKSGAGVRCLIMPC